MADGYLHLKDLPLHALQLALGQQLAHGALGVQARHKTRPVTVEIQRGGDGGRIAPGGDTWHRRCICRNACMGRSGRICRRGYVCCSRGMCGCSSMCHGGRCRSGSLHGRRYRNGRLHSRCARRGCLHGRCGRGGFMRDRLVRGGRMGRRSRRCRSIRPGATGCLRPAVGRGVEIEILPGRSRPVVVSRGTGGRFTACRLACTCLARGGSRRPRHGCLSRCPRAVAATGHHGGGHLASTGARIHGGIAPLP